MSRIRRRQPEARKPRRPRDSRRIPVADETEQDNGTLYHCWWCGFTCNDSRDSLGGDDTPNGVTHSDFTEEALGDLSSKLMLSGIELTQRIPVSRAGSDGNPQTVVHYHSVSTNGGCPFCGCKNYRGDY